MRTVARAVVWLTFVAVLAAGAAVGAVAWSLRAYARLTFEQPVAQIDFEARGPQEYLATLTRLPSRETQMFILAGDEWQLDARVLKWRGAATLLGLDARYRLERVSGRYRDLEKERHAPRSVFALDEPERIDLWAFAQAHPRWIPFVDAVYGSATYLPMAENARYEVALTQSGLVARPKNQAARAVSGGWR